MRLRGKTGLFVLALLAAPAAQASDKQDFVACDGLKQPGKKDDGMRGVASTPGFSFGGLSAAPRSTATIAACTRALESPRLLAHQGLRRAHLLRARAAAYLEAKEPAKALADLDRADAAAGALRGDPFYRRSMGASLLLLRSVAKAQQGDYATAQGLARQAVDARPYSLDVQLVAATIQQAARPIGTPSPSPWHTLALLEPDAAATELNREAQLGNFAAVLALRPGVALVWPQDDKAASIADVLNNTKLTDFASAMLVTINTAYAHAAGGDGESARSELAELRSQLDSFRAKAPNSEQMLDVLTRYAEQSGKQVEARIAVAEGRHTDAVAALVGTPMPSNAATLELVAALKASAPEDIAALVPDAAARRTELEADRGDGLPALARSALLAYESPRAVVDYERARPNVLGELLGAAFSMGTTLLDGIDRKDGFRSTTNPDGTLKVEFIGNTPSRSMVQEMTLLRAAELAQAAGKPAFVIVDRNDYARTLQTSRGGVPISSTPQGFKTELTVRFVDDAAGQHRAIDALALIDALGPLYYQEAAPRLAAR